MLDKDTLTTLSLLARHSLTTAGGGLVASGVITGGQLQDAIGAALTIVGVVLSIYQKRHQKAAIVAAVVAAPAA